MDRKTAGISLGIIAIVILGYFLFNGLGSSVAAQGQSSLKVQPDEISISLMIESKNASLQDAQRENARISSAVIAALRGLGIKEENIQAENYYTNEWGEWTDGKYEKKGYQVNQPISVKIESFTIAPGVIDAVINAGSLVQGIQFELSQEKENEYKTKASEQASKAAKDKANAIAAGQGKRLGRLVSLRTDEVNYQPYPYYLAKDSGIGVMEAREAAAQIAPKELEISASVSVEYKLSVF